MAVTPEGRLEDYFLAECRAHGLLCLKFTAPARGGVPDRIVVGQRGTVLVELKRTGGQPDPRQVAMHTKIRRHGGTVIVVDSRAAIDRFIENFVRSTPATSDRARPRHRHRSKTPEVA